MFTKIEMPTNNNQCYTKNEFKLTDTYRYISDNSHNIFLIQGLYYMILMYKLYYCKLSLQSSQFFLRERVTNVLSFK